MLDRGKPRVSGLAADQVYMMSSELDAYQVSGDRKYLDRASALGALIFGSYRDSSTGLVQSRAPVTAGTVVTQAASGAPLAHAEQRRGTLEGTSLVTEQVRGVVDGGSATVSVAHHPLAVPRSLELGRSLAVARIDARPVDIATGRSAGAADAGSGTAIP